METKKWKIENLPEKYPTSCSRKELNYVIKDLSNEFVTRIIKDDKDFFNKGWRDRIVAFIQLGQSELQHRNNNLVLIASVFSLVIALIAVYLSMVSLRSSSNWESSQIQILEEQKQIQQKILEIVS